MIRKVSPNDYKELLRRDLYAFIERSFYELNPTTTFLPNWHIQVIASHLEECRRGDKRRLCINEPPRSLKSHCASVALPAYILGHDPSAKIICASYGQDLANKHAMDCRTVMNSAWYRKLFPHTRFSAERQALQEFITTEQGYRLSTSVGGVLTGRGADYIIIDDPLKPEEALSDTQRKAVNGWFDHTLYSRLNDKRYGRIILVMQRLHQDDLVGHVLEMEPWTVIRFPAIAEEDEYHLIQTPYGTERFERRAGEALHPAREPLEVLQHIRESLGEYNFSGQYQQAPSPLGGGLVKTDWFKTYTDADVPAKFEYTFQSWDTANKPEDLNNFSVCTTWGVKEKHIYLLHVYRKRLGYPELKRAVCEQAAAFNPKTILIEDRASGTQLIQDLVSEGMHAVKKYEPEGNKIIRMNNVTAMIENGFVHLPDKAPWLGDFVYEIASFPTGKYDDQADSTSQALDWFRTSSASDVYGLFDFYRKEQNKLQNSEPEPADLPKCTGCNGGVMSQRIPGGFRCPQCGSQCLSPAGKPRFYNPTRSQMLNEAERFSLLSRFVIRRKR